MPDQPSWRPEAVLKSLQERSRKGEPLRVQVFLSGDVDKQDVSARAKEIVESAAQSAGAEAGSFQLGKVFPLAKSFSLSADKPEIFEQMVKHQHVKSMLESEQPDILPKPLNRGPTE